ncbi:hypothetical protein GGR56DRAFT_234837 [Xylariaceae sp. FL0804]|nr:hypothetical protein GGR56DRAFT_234837 [Xylariaceae sp. FL0804]
MEAAPDPGNATDAARHDLLHRCELLKGDLDRLGDHIAKVYEGYPKPEIPPSLIHHYLSKQLQWEIDYLRRNAGSRDPVAAHGLSSSNLPFYQAVWDTARRARDIVKIHHNACLSTEKVWAPGRRITLSDHISEKKKATGFIVDLIADGGLSWYKVSTMTNQRILFDMAREAIFCSDSDSDREDEGTDGRNGERDEDFSDIPLVKLARRFTQVARGNRIRGRSPTPHLVLTRVFAGEDVGIDKILASCRRMGADILCANDLLADPAPPTLTPALLRRMVPGPRAGVSAGPLNIDTSILVAVTADMSNARESEARRPWWKKPHFEHARIEAREPMLPQVLPLLAGRDLVCTREAAASFYKIAHSIMTDSENARASLLLRVDDPDPDPDPDSDMSSPARRRRVEELRALSIHPVPSDLRLPIRVVDADEDDDGEDACGGGQARFGRDIREVLETLENPTRAVLAYGWARRCTTVTCNSVAPRELERALDTLEHHDTSDWPSVLLFPVSRPLTGTPLDGNIHIRVRKHLADCKTKCNCGLVWWSGGRSDVMIEDL